jgi:hypothetical protein
VSQAGTALEPYSHSSASREQESPIAGMELGQGPEVAPLSSLPALASEGGTDPPPPASLRPASSLAPASVPPALNEDPPHAHAPATTIPASAPTPRVLSLIRSA